MYTRKNRIYLLFNIIIPIFIGAVIYCLTSPDVFFVKAAKAIFKLSDWVIISDFGNLLIRFVRNYTPDMAWGYALVFSMYAIAGSQTEKGLYGLAFIAIVFSVAIEFLQMVSIIRGTFDLWDIAAELPTEVTAVFIIKKNY
jgi:hypothetical protein